MSLRWRPVAAVALGVGLMAGCGDAPKQAAPEAEKPRAESDLAVTKLSREAVRSLQIESKAARAETLPERRSYTGWVQARPGNEVTVTAPVAGYVRAADKLPARGAGVEADQALFLIEPILTPLDQVQLASLKRTVDADVTRARENLAVAESELKRIKELHEQKLRGLQEVEQAQAKLNIAKEDVAAALDRQKLFSAPGSKGLLPPIPLKAPHGGTILTVQTSPGQYVPAAAPLLTIGDLSGAWLRVPVPEQDLPRVDRGGTATVVLAPAPRRTVNGRPLAMVPEVDPLKRTADLLYELKDPGQTLTKDQRFLVEVPLTRLPEENDKERVRSVVVPYGAVVFDAYGGAWVYIDRGKETDDPHLYERRRVELGPSLGDTDIVVRRGVKESEQVVTNAAALFSREFFFPPVPMAGKQEVEDDD